MVNTWIDTYMAMLEEGDELPVDLIGRASEIARELREERRRRRGTLAQRNN